MPNYCQNKLTILGSEEELDILLESAKLCTGTGGYQTQNVILHHIYEGLDETRRYSEFQSARDPPFVVLAQKVSKDLPRLVFCLSFYEPGCIWGGACSSGRAL